MEKVETGKGKAEFIFLPSSNDSQDIDIFKFYYSQLTVHDVKSMLFASMVLLSSGEDDQACQVEDRGKIVLSFEDQV